MKIGPMFLLAAAMAGEGVAGNDMLRGMTAEQDPQDSSEHEDDPPQLLVVPVVVDQPAASHATTQAHPIATDHSLLSVLLVDQPSQRKLDRLKTKKKLEKAQRRKAAQRNIIKRDINDEHDPDDFQFEIDDFVASIESAHVRMERKKKRQELKMLQ